MKKDSGKKKALYAIAAVLVTAFIIAGFLYCRSSSLTADEEIQTASDTKTEEKETEKEKTGVPAEIKEDKNVQDETTEERSPEDEGAGQTVLPDDNTDPSSSPERKGHYETMQVLVSEAWDEQVLVKKGTCEDILISEAWDEEVSSCYAFGREYETGYECGICGYQTTGDISSHIRSEHDGAGSWHNVKIYTSEEKCLDYQTEVIHHDAVYQTVCEEDEYAIVHHDAVYRSETVWIDD
ncbi:MAG: hypothetical protein IJK53_07305 [Erysipelotrichaceae bacterium]|nr:hypothetical protein [Clostridia bacterium]MBQ6217176.1 hypothetical protein [Erysipelotrichaceae bacterium]